jgi:hypothetical protein
VKRRLTPEARAHGIRDQADVGPGHLLWRERKLCERQLTSACDAEAMLLRCLLTCRTNWWYRP